MSRLNCHSNVVHRTQVRLLRIFVLRTSDTLVLFETAVWLRVSTVAVCIGVPHGSCHSDKHPRDGLRFFRQTYFLVVRVNSCFKSFAPFCEICYSIP